MKTLYRKLVNINGRVQFMEVPEEEVLVNTKCRLAIDGSTSNTGAAIIRDDGALLYTMCFSRDPKGADKSESPVRYKLQLKNKVANILRRNRGIQKTFYEEPVLDHVTSIPSLMMLRTFIEEMIIESEPEFDYVVHGEVNNKRWKKTIMGDASLAGSSEAEKKQVKDKLLSMLPCADVLTQDEIDATLMGIATVMYDSQGWGAEELASKKAIRPFKYNAQFIGADSDEGMFEEFMDLEGIPKRVMENGIVVTELKGREKFDRQIYKCMGDDDKVVILKYASDKYCNIALEYKLGFLISQYDYIYAVVWRKTRRYK